MNYRHVYHAGNFADVLKHIVLVLCLGYLQKKDGGLCLVDAHGGAGLYRLDSEEAGKTGEWERGIGSLAGRDDAPPDITAYLDLVRSDFVAQRYPGSPFLMAQMARSQDRFIACELHAPTFEILRAVLAPYRTARAVHMDGYECIRARIPPKERRGLMLIDPPFERKDEFQRLAKQMEAWKKRWATGVYLLWYPIKAHLPVENLKEAARELSLPRTWCAEILIQPRYRPDTLNGCGVILFNAPYTVPERIEAILPYLKNAMTLHETVSARLVPG